MLDAFSATPLLSQAFSFFLSFLFFWRLCGPKYALNEAEVIGIGNILQGKLRRHTGKKEFLNNCFIVSRTTFSMWFSAAQAHLSLIQLSYNNSRDRVFFLINVLACMSFNGLMSIFWTTSPEIKTLPSYISSTRCRRALSISGYVHSFFCFCWECKKLHTSSRLTILLNCLENVDWRVINVKFSPWNSHSAIDFRVMSSLALRRRAISSIIPCFCALFNIRKTVCQVLRQAKAGIETWWPNWPRRKYCTTISLAKDKTERKKNRPSKRCYCNTI